MNTLHKAQFPATHTAGQLHGSGHALVAGLALGIASVMAFRRMKRSMRWLFRKIGRGSRNVAGVVVLLLVLLILGGCIFLIAAVPGWGLVLGIIGILLLLGSVLFGVMSQVGDRTKPQTNSF